MPRETDNSDHPSTLPQAELNPLLNPLLGQNMGRWAEVYFTSPPEKREQAVLELVRELEAQNSQRQESAVPLPTDEEQVSAPEVSQPFPVAEFQPGSITCPSCGHGNTPDQKFCGMCGAQINDQQIAGRQSTGWQMDAAHSEREPHRENGQPRFSSADPFFSPDPDIREPIDVAPRMVASEPVPVQAVRDILINNRAGLGLDVEPAGPPYRVFVGMVLAILITALAYIAWRSTQATSVISHGVPQTAPATTSQPAAPAPADPAKTDAPQPSAPASQEASPSPGPAKTASDEAPGTTLHPVKMAHPAPPPLEGISQPPATFGNGSDELAIAQSYLNGTDGRERNTAQAAGWLWKAVAKQNGEATLLLSSLYLKGDGVSKSCDQARLLLDAAARKGIKNAGEQLRHLQAFGCE